MIKIINSIPYSTDSSCRLGYFQHRTWILLITGKNYISLGREPISSTSREEKAVPIVSRVIRFRPQDVTSQF